MILLLTFLFGSGLGSAPAFANVPAETGASAVESIMNEDFIRSLRDPFEEPMELKRAKAKPMSDLEMYPVRDFKLNGVITGPKKIRAMVTSPKGQTFFLKVGDVIGAKEGRITQIHPDTVRVVEFYTDDRGQRMPETYEMRITGEVELVDRKERN